MSASVGTTPVPELMLPPALFVTVTATLAPSQPGSAIPATVTLLTFEPDTL